MHSSSGAASSSAAASAAASASPAAAAAASTAPVMGGLLSSFASSRLSSSELAYISAGVAGNCRADGRARLDFRPLSVETGVVSHANGSARIRLEQTAVLAAVNLSMQAPDANRARCEGVVACSVEQSAACSSGAELDDRAAQAKCAVLTGELARVLARSQAIPLTSLVIVPDQQVWRVDVDVLVLESGGNLSDAILMAVKAALMDTTLPPIEVHAGGDGGQTEIVLNDDPSASLPLPHAAELPLLISLCKIGVSGEWILDASADEEECMSLRVSLAVNPAGEVCGVSKSGIGTINQQALENITQHAAQMGQQINKKLMQAVKEGSAKRKSAA